MTPTIKYLFRQLFKKDALLQQWKTASIIYSKYGLPV
jgi:hypothetical protein